MMFEVGDEFTVSPEEIFADMEMWNTTYIISKITDKKVIVSWYERGGEKMYIDYDLCDVIDYFNKNEWILNIKLKRKKKLESILKKQL